MKESIEDKELKLLELLEGQSVDANECANIICTMPQNKAGELSAELLKRLAELKDFNGLSAALHKIGGQRHDDRSIWMRPSASRSNSRASFQGSRRRPPERIVCNFCRIRHDPASTVSGTAGHAYLPSSGNACSQRKLRSGRSQKTRLFLQARHCGLPAPQRPPNRISGCVRSSASPRRRPYSCDPASAPGRN